MFYKFSRYEAMRLTAVILSWPLMLFTIVASMAPSHADRLEVGLSCLLYLGLWLIGAGGAVATWYSGRFAIRRLYRQAAAKQLAVPAKPIHL